MRKLKNIFFKPKLWYFAVYIFIVLAFCEYFIYYIVLSACSWPSSTSNVVKALLIADPHLLGIRHGHWFDKLRREWQMYRSFQTAIVYFRPDAVFVLGDLFDEAQWSRREEFMMYVNRFESMFKSKAFKLYAVPGNHDLGFHYSLLGERSDWFSESFQTDVVQLVSLNDVHFVLINSMAMENDGCSLCEKAKYELKQINATLSCAKHEDKEDCANIKTPLSYSQPVLLQHFPLYRQSDQLCNEPDEAPAKLKSEAFRETWECLSNSSSEFLFETLQPRVAFSGHTHHGCRTYHKDGHLIEYTISSFSWRNINSPTLLLATFGSETYDVNKCYLPKESLVISIYVISAIFLFLWICLLFYKKFCMIPLKVL